jgi:L-ascorbate metabolism protein UlaG (beta-lactamase superfamily)
MWSWLLGAGALGLTAAVGAGRSFSAPRFRGRVDGTHFDGERFRNRVPVEHGPREALKWMRTRKPGPWRPYTDAPPGPPPPRRVGRGALRATFVNHATVLIQMDGLNVLTDPVWSERTSPVTWAGPRRARPPGLRFEDLPPIDAVLVSHNHYDHLDLDTLHRLAEAHDPRFLTGLGNARTLAEVGIRKVVELDWNQGADLSPAVRATFVEARHFSGRGLGDKDFTLWGGFVLTGPGGPVYFAGDTGYGPHFVEIRQRFGPPRLALLPIGAFQPTWFMSPVHMSPMDAVLAHIELVPALSMGIHFGTFPLADDGQDEPVEGLAAARATAGVPERRFIVPVHGEGVDVPET